MEEYKMVNILNITGCLWIVECIQDMFCAAQSSVAIVSVCRAYLLCSQWLPVFSTVPLDNLQRSDVNICIHGSVQSNAAECGQT